MKKLLFSALCILGLLVFKSADAQIKLSINIGNQPDWAPTGYDHADYYYLPDIDCYYDVTNRQYVYQNGNSWAKSASLPAKYGSYNLYNGYKAVINKPQPWLQEKTYKAQYASYKGRKSQPVIRDSKDAKYKPAQHNDHNSPAKAKADDHGHDDKHH
jgi:hypothetical protein